MILTWIFDVVTVSLLWYSAKVSGEKKQIKVKIVCAFVVFCILPVIHSFMPKRKDLY